VTSEFTSKFLPTGWAPRLIVVCSAHRLCGFNIFELGYDYVLVYKCQLSPQYAGTPQFDLARTKYTKTIAYNI
jgi:hypothetical protein